MTYSRGKFKANDSQSASIIHPPAPLMIIAGAGTGKTTTLLHRIIYLIEHHGVAPEHLLAITYTEKAAQELKSRIVAEVGTRAEEMTVGTFHAFCYSIVKEFAFQAGEKPALIEEGDSVYTLLDRFDKLGPFESKEFPKDPVKSVTDSFLPFLNSLRDELIDPAVMEIPEDDGDPDKIEDNAQLRDLVRIYGLYRQWKLDAGQVDYGDMISRCRELLDNQAILATLRERYRHLIVDEFQDNNFALNEVLGCLAKDRGSITVVGDDDQVIYSFRGASAYNISDFKQRYGKLPDYREITLVENYRSAQPILDAANAAIDKNTGRMPKELVNPGSSDGIRPALLVGDTATQNGNLPDLIHKIIEDGYGFGDIAILCRTRSQAREAARSLVPAHLPVNLFLNDYFDLPVIRDILSWAEVTAGGSHCDSAFYRLLCEAIGESSATSIFGAFSRYDMTSRFSLVRKYYRAAPDDYPDQLGQLINTIEKLRYDNSKKNAGEMVWEICEQTSLLRKYAKRYEYSDRVNLANAGDLVSRAQEFSRRYDNNSLRHFLHYILTLRRSNSIAAKEPPRNKFSSAITIQTIHAAKGLEYPVVIIPYNQSQRFPMYYRKSKLIDSPPSSWSPVETDGSLAPRDAHYQEERRLFYVAMTRAEEQLYLLAPEKRTSPFIKELPAKLIRRIEMEATEQQNGADIYHGLRVEYEQRLASALSQDQFQLAQDFLSVLERLTAIARGNDFYWGESAWEKELQEKLAEKPLPEIPERLLLSASSIDTYSQCPLKYRLSHIDNVPETASKPQLTFGNIIHQVLEHFHQEKCSTEEELLDLLEQFWTSEGFEYESREISFKEQGRDLLKNYFKYFQGSPPEVVGTEYKFKFDLPSCSIRGMIDRIDSVEGGYRVVDYKTGSASTKPEKSLQLAVYCMYLAQQEEKEPKGLPVAASLLYLREEEMEQSHSFTEKELDDFRQQIDEVVTGISSREFEPKKNRHCDWCDYKHLLCPAWEE